MWRHPPAHAYARALHTCTAQALRTDHALSLLERQLGQPRTAFLAQPALHWSVKGLRDDHAHGIAHVLRSNKALQELGLARNQQPRVVGEDSLVRCRLASPTA